MFFCFFDGWSTMTVFVVVVFRFDVNVVDELFAGLALASFMTTVRTLIIVDECFKILVKACLNTNFSRLQDGSMQLIQTY